MVILAISSNLYTLFNIKAFWLDEWFILHNLKTKSYLELIGQLDYIQQFPRIYLIIIKYLGQTTDYNYYVIRLIPTTAQIFNILFIVFSISRILFKESLLKRNLFILFFLSFQTTIFYFTQLKQYTIEMTVALFGIWFFDFLCNDRTRKTLFSNGYIAFLSYLIIAPFFSYTYIFVIAPILLILFFTLINKNNNLEAKIKSLIPLIFFFISIGLNYFTDLRFVLSSKQQYAAFSENVFGWHSLYSILRGFINLYKLPGYLFIYTPSEFNPMIVTIFFVVKFTIIALTIFGAYHIFKALLKEHLNQKDNLVLFLSLKNDMSIRLYLCLSFIIMIILYLFGKLPIGHARLNYFSILFLIVFLLEGSEILSQKNLAFNRVILTLLMFTSIYQGVRGYIREYQNKNLLFDQKIFDTIGLAIHTAKLKNLPIFVKDNEFYPHSFMEHAEQLAIKTHPSYSINQSPRVEVFYGNKPPRLGSSYINSSYILLKKHSYTVVDSINSIQ
jgi:hypothetical protein